MSYKKTPNNPIMCGKMNEANRARYLADMIWQAMRPQFEKTQMTNEHNHDRKTMW